MPDDDVVDFLLGQHARIEELFATVINGRGDTRKRAFDELADLLEVHEMAEQQLVHPLARDSIDAGPDVVAARLAEERQASELLTALRANGVTDPGFDTGIMALRDAVLAHATYEERYEFTQLRQHNSARQLRTTAAAVEQAQATTATGPGGMVVG
jgi:DNA-binding transcriptional ArsR family regulator